MSITSSIAALGRPIAFYPCLARAFGDINTAVLVCQFIYWRSKVGDREIYKTREEIESETFIQPDTQRRIFNRLKKDGFVEVVKKGLPAKNFYKWNWEAIDKFVNFSSQKDQKTVGTSTSKIQAPEPAECNDTTLQSATTTSETTTETTTDIPPNPQKGEAGKPQKRTRKAFGISDLLANNPHDIDEQVLSDWLVSRDKNRAAVTATVWSCVSKELDKCAASGVSATEALTTAVMAGWRGFEASWVLNRKTNNTRHAAANSYDCPKCGSHMDDCICWAETINEGPF